jgi:hypothetical protein
VGRPSNAEIAARNAASEPDAPQADNQFLEADEEVGRELEPFERPVEKVTADQPTPAGKVKIRVLPKGDGKVATGKYDRQTNSFTYHKKGDHLFVHESIAKTQEDNGLVEIVE